MAFCVGGSHLASCSLDGSLAVWSLDAMEQVVLFQAPKKVTVQPSTLLMLPFSLAIVIK